MPETKAATLSEVSETLLIPLYYRAIETQRPDAMIKDEKAVELIKRLSSEESIRYDSEWFKKTPMSRRDLPPQIRSKTSDRIGPNRRQKLWQSRKYLQQNRSS